MEWDLLRSFEATVRCGSLSRAAKSLGLSQSTLSRHLARLEAQAGVPLIERGSPISLTERGAALLDALVPMVDAALAARTALESDQQLRGEVCVTMVGEVLRWVLADRIPEFCRAHPQVRLRLRVSNRIESLAAGEADIALRFTRPRSGDLITRKLRTESYGLYLAKACVGKVAPAETPWLGLTGALSELTEQRHAEEAFADRIPRVLVEDLQTLGQLVQLGLGVAVLPSGFASTLEGVVEVDAAQVGARIRGVPPVRGLWLVSHRAKHRLPKVRAVLDWLVDVLGQ